MKCISNNTTDGLMRKIRRVSINQQHTTSELVEEISSDTT